MRIPWRDAHPPNRFGFLGRQSAYVGPLFNTFGQQFAHEMGIRLAQIIIEKGPPILRPTAERYLSSHFVAEPLRLRYHPTQVVESLERSCSIRIVRGTRP